MKQATLTISGMHCGGCVASVDRVLAKLPGVGERKISVGTATLTVDESQVGEAQLREAVDGAGFDVTAVSWS